MDEADTLRAYVSWGVVTRSRNRIQRKRENEFCPFSSYIDVQVSDYCTPRRVRVVVSSGELDKVYIEGIREIS